MIDPADAEHSEEPQQSFAFTRAFFCACLVALIWTIVLLGFIAAKTSVAATIAATLASVAAMVAALIGIFQRPKFPTIDPQVTRGVVAAILVVDFLLSVGWIGWSYYQANRTIDVLSTVTLSKNIDVLPGGHATLDLTVTAQRETLVLIFRIIDHNGAIGSCAPNTSLDVTPDMAGNRLETVSTSSGLEMVVDLSTKATKLSMDIAVKNSREDKNCGVDLSVVSAKLQNK